MLSCPPLALAPPLSLHMHMQMWQIALGLIIAGQLPTLPNYTRDEKLCQPARNVSEVIEINVLIYQICP